jgi:hypothetical protein
MLLLLPSLLCSAYSDLAIDDLPTILCTISSKRIRIFSAASSHNANLLRTFYTHAIFITVLAINEKNSLSIKYLPTISPFGIDGSTSTHMHSDSPPRLFSPPLTSMSKKKHAPPELLQKHTPPVNYEHLGNTPDIQ